MLDLYERTAGGTSLLSTGPTDDGTATAWSFLGDASADGTHVYFESLDRLTPDATEGSSNLYERVGATTTLIPGNHPFAAVAHDGSRVIVTSTAQLTPDDLDAAEDIYEWSAGTMTLVSTGPQAGAANTFPATPIYTSPDGTRVFFETREALVAEDTDTSRDIYERSGGVTSLRSTGPQVAPVTFLAVRGDGDHVFFTTNEALVAEDTDGMAGRLRELERDDLDRLRRACIRTPHSMPGSREPPPMDRGSSLPRWSRSRRTTRTPIMPTSMSAPEVSRP